MGGIVPHPNSHGDPRHAWACFSGLVGAWSTSWHGNAGYMVSLCQPQLSSSQGACLGQTDSVTMVLSLFSRPHVT